MYSADSEPSETSDIIAVNVDATVPVLAHAITFHLSGVRKDGLMLNTGSFGGIVPSLMLATSPSGTEAFVDRFSTALAGEVRNRGVTIWQCINPYFAVSGVTQPVRLRRCRKRRKFGSPALYIITQPPHSSMLRRIGSAFLMARTLLVDLPNLRRIGLTLSWGASLGFWGGSRLRKFTHTRPASTEDFHFHNVPL